MVSSTRRTRRRPWSAPWSLDPVVAGSQRSSISAGTCHGKDFGRFDRSATAARRQPASGSSTGTPPDETALPRGRSPPGAMSCPEQPSDSCSRRSLLQCNGQSDMWHEQAVVVHLGFDGRDEHAPPGRGECRSGGPLHGRCAGSGQWPGARRPGRSPSRRLAGAAPGPLWCPCRLRAAPGWPCSSPRSSTFDPAASKIRSPSSPSMAISAKSLQLVDSRATVSIASNCGWVSPNVRDPAGTVGRRTYSAGE